MKHTWSSSVRASAACRGARIGGAGVEITIIDQRNHHLFQPFCTRSDRDARHLGNRLAHPSPDAKRREVTTLLGTVSGVDALNRTVLLEDGGAAAYDTLVLATGASTPISARRMEPYAPGSKLWRTPPRSGGGYCCPSSERARDRSGAPRRPADFCDRRRRATGWN